MKKKQIMKINAQTAMLIIIAILVLLSSILGFLLFCTSQDRGLVDTNKGYDMPDKTLEKFYQSVAAGRYNEALSLFDAKERTEGYDLATVIELYQYYIPNQMAINSADPSFEVLNQQHFQGEAARQLKYLVLGLMDLEDEGGQKKSLNQSLAADFFGDSDAVIEAMNSESLSDLTLVRTDIMDEATQNSENYQENVEQLKKCYGCEDIKQYAALLKLGDTYYMGSLTLVQYQGNWKIMSLNGNFGQEDGTAVLIETTEEAYQRELESKEVQQED